jgi:hypothetical protein
MIEERLLIVLRERASTRGIVPVRGDVLAKEVEASQEDVGAAVDKLARAGLLEILAPFPFLVLRLRTWSGKNAKTPDSLPSAYSAIQLSHSQHVNSSYRRPGAHWPIDAALLHEILETVGEADGKSFEKAVELYSPHVIRLALDRVRRTKGIRKSRTALFRHLLPRLARDEHRFDKPT